MLSFIKFQNNIKDRVDTRFGLLFQTTVDYGSGPVPIAKVLGRDDICKDNPGYNVGSDIFNVTSMDADNGTGKPYNLYTQIVGRPFDVKVCSHDVNYIHSDHRLSTANTAIEMEVFNADYYPRDANLSCVMPDSNISSSLFVNFNNQSSIDLKDFTAGGNGFTIDRAVRNAGFRIWYLAKQDGSSVDNPCADSLDQTCYETLYNNEFKSFETLERNCTVECSGSEGCYSCIKGYYGVPVCSKDNFSVRPESFVAEISDNGQSEESIQPILQQIANSSSQNGSANIVASYRYRLDINATSYNSDIGVKGYYRTLDNNSSSDISVASFTADTATLPNCNDISDINITTTLFDGTNINQKYKKNFLVSIDQIGRYLYQARDKNWTAVDWDSSLSTHHQGDGFENDIPDCLIDNDTVTATGRQGCDISTTHTRVLYGTEYRDLDLTLYPYKFSTSLTLSSPIQDGGDANFVYINTLDRTRDYPLGYRDTGDKNMSYNVQGSFTAVGWGAGGSGGTALSNFVNGCYTQDVNMILRHQYLYPDTPPANEANLTADLYNYRPDNNNPIYRGQKTFTDSYSSNATTESTLTQLGSHFIKDMNGSVTMDLGYNFDRNISNPINPRRIWMEDFNITLASQPHTLYVDGINNHQIYGNIDVDQNVTFAYGRARSTVEFYDNIEENSTLTPIQVVVYCDLGFALCQERGIDVNNGQTNEYNWWLSLDHKSDGQDGNIVIKAQNSNALSSDPLSIDITSNGENSNVTVTYAGSSKPHIENIKLVTFSDNPAQYTDRWLIYNEDNDTTPPDPFYRVRFMGSPSGWTGKGKTGHVVEDDINNRKIRRLGW